MNKRNQLNLGLFLFILLLGGLAYFDTVEDEIQNESISNLSQQDIQDITIKRSNKADIFLQKKYNKWRLVKPYNTDVNQFRLDTLLRLVETRAHSSYPLSNSERYGLDTPKLEVQFNKNTNKAISIKFGDSEPIRSRRYISVNDTLYLTNDTYFYALNSVATDYINPKILPTDFAIKGLELPNLTLEIKDQRWHATPKPENFSVDNINELISEWQTAQASKIEPFTLNLNSMSSKRITLFSKDASTITLHLLINTEAFILVDQLKGLQYTLPIEKKDLLLTLADNNTAATD